SISRGKSCPSPAAIGQPQVTQSEDWYKAAGALFGLTPKKYQSGEKDVTGGVTRTGDGMGGTALYEAANVLLSRITRFSKLKRWGMDVAKRRGTSGSRGLCSARLRLVFLPDQACAAIGFASAHR